MKLSLTFLALPAMLAIGCGGSTKKPPPVTHDLAVKTDMVTGDGCTQIDTWPTSKLGAFSDTTEPGYTYVDGVYDVEVNATNAAHHDELLYRYYQQSGKPAATVPHDYDIDPSDNFSTCVDCLTAFLDYDPNDDSTGTFYFATQGSLHVSKLDNGTITGTVAASGTGIKLVQWNYDTSTMPIKDEPVDGGKCYDVGSFDFTAMYDNTPTDGGTDGGN